MRRAARTFERARRLVAGPSQPALYVARHRPQGLRSERVHFVREALEARAPQLQDRRQSVPTAGIDEPLVVLGAESAGKGLGSRFVVTLPARLDLARPAMSDTRRPGLRGERRQP